MEIKTMPKETLGDLLHFIADTESFQETLNLLGDSVEVGQLKRALRELGTRLRDEAKDEAPATAAMNLKQNPFLTEQVKEIISYLTPKEERKVIERFGFLEKE